MTDINQAYSRFLKADENWTKQIKKHCKGRPGDVRYTAAAKGMPGTPLRAAYDELTNASNAWHELAREEQNVAL